MSLRVAAILALVASQAGAQAPGKGVLLEDVSWVEAEKLLTPSTVVVIPLGAEAKEHGPHLLLKNDFVMAEYLKKRVLAASAVVMAPTLNYGFYPAFLEYPGSTSLELDTARDVVADVCRTLSRYGPKRFYILNTGVSTARALGPAAEILAAQGILMRYSDMLNINDAMEKEVRQEAGGTHAEEIETSMMLYMAPETVTIQKAVKDYHGQGSGSLTRDPKGPGTYSPSGVWGDATLASREKGRKLTEALVTNIKSEIEALRTAPLPERTLDAIDFATYSGTYRSKSGNVVKIAVQGHRMFLEREGAPRAELQPITADRFTTGAIPIRFFRDGANHITYLTVWLNGREVTAGRD